MAPVTLSSTHDPAALRDSLQQVGFDEEAICRRRGITSIYDFKVRVEEGKPPEQDEDALGLLVRLLMDGEAAEESELRRTLPTRLVAQLEGHGLLIPHPSKPGHRVASVTLYPTEGLLIASDRAVAVENEKPPVDYVYPAVTHNTRRFLAALPPRACEAALDLCSGSGAAALLAARGYARHAWACDITERSTQFSEFNRRLNGLENVTVARGDLYAAVEGATFDRITAHPPYVPARATTWVFRDGGEDGEQVTRRIIEGLPRYLRPGGDFHAVALATDREDETVEQRVRRWLGETQGEFDVVLATIDVEPPKKPVDPLLAARTRLREILETRELYDRLKVKEIFYGAITIRRHAQPGAAITARARQAEPVGWRGPDWLARWESAALDPGFPGYLLNAHPTLSPRLQLLVAHQVREGALVPARYRLNVQSPFVFDADCHPWVALLAGACDGRTPVAEILATLKEQEVVNPNIELAEFLSILRLLIANGVVTLPEFPLPESGERR